MIPARTDKAAARGPVPAGFAVEPCKPLALAPLGDPGGAVGSGTIEPQGTVCFTVVVTNPGLHRLLVSHPFAYPSLSSGGNKVACEEPRSSWCELAAGTYTLSVSNGSGDPAANRVSLVPLMAAPGCPAVAGTSYDSAPAKGLAVDPVGVVCHAFTAAPGERISADFQLAKYGESWHWISDDTGKRLCDAATDCILPAGVGGYRVLAEVGHYSAPFPAPYTLKVRRLSNPAGCVPVAVTAYNSAPAQAAPQTECRTFTPTATGLYAVGDINAQGEVGAVPMRTADGSAVCEDGQDCSLTAGVPYTLLTDRAVRILSLTATAGCQSGVALARDHKGTFTVPGEVGCLNLPVPQGAHVAVLSDGGAHITVLDAKGTAFCQYTLEDGTCVLGGTAPYRALVSKRDPHEKGDVYRLVVHRTDAPSACRTFLPGDFTGKPVRMSVKTSTEVFSGCLSIGADQHAAREIFQIQRISGDSDARVSILDAKGKPICTIGGSYGTFASCTLTAKTAHTVLVRGRNVPAEFALTRLDVTATARGCVPTAATPVGGPSTGGVPAKPGTFLCHQVSTPDAADTLHLNARDAQGSARLLVYTANGDGACDYYTSGCAVTGSTRYQAVLLVPEGKTAAPAYRLDALRIGTAAGPAPECVKVPNVSYGFGRLAASLSEQKTAICAVLPTASSDRFDLRFTPAGTTEQSPTPWMYDRSTLKNGCSVFTCTVPSASPKASRPSTLVIGLPEKPAGASTTVQVDATCASIVCGPDARTVSTVGPSTVGRGKITMTVTGGALREDAVVEVRGGSFKVRSTNTVVAPDRRRMTVALDLTKAPLGPLSVSVYAHGQEYGMRLVSVVAPIRSTAAPTIKGTAVVGGTVTATPGTWTPAADSYAYQWLADGKAIAGATTASYTLPTALQGKQLTLVVTARKAGHPSVQATSTDALVKGAAPKAAKAPAITGTVKVGNVLTANRGTWTPAATSYTYQWYADGKAITGATGRIFTLTTAQRGKRITLRVTANRTGHVPGTALSPATGTVTG